MTAGFLAVGTELLGADRLDTNSLRLTEVLADHGIELRRKAVVGDVEADIRRELLGMVGELSVVVVSGGLGPTADDVTRTAVAEALGRALQEDPAVVADIREKFRRFGRDMPEVNRRQAEVPEGAVLIANSQGTAPGLRLHQSGTAIFVLPGVPRELEAMVQSHLVPWLAANTPGTAREMVVLKVACLAESEVEQRIAPAYGEFGRENVTILAKPGEITLRATAAGPQAERRRRLETMRDRLAELVGNAVYSFEDESLEEVVGRLLASAGQTVSTAESCTGGLVAERLTRVAGSSLYFQGGVVTYSNALKEGLLGVPRTLLEEHGAVSEAVARAMAEGARRALATDWSLAVTGVAGPGGGSEAKPVGTVHLGLAGPDGEVAHRRVQFPGDRERIRWLSSQWLLEMLRRRLLRLEERA